MTTAGGDATEIAIAVKGVSKHYRVYKSRSSFISEALLGKRTATIKPVLDDINLEMRRGEVVGIIGRNGAGKSTLLKLIAGTIPPSAGKIEIRGRVSAILELGTGFNPAYTGRDNVIMSALMRGMSETDIKKKLPSIVAFAGLEDAIDQPFQTYSSGMQARLAFAAAVAVEADVIIIDEALAAGDIRFTARSLRRVREICESGVTALFVSHQTYHVMQLCSRAIWIDNGRIRMDGPPIDVCRAYEYEMQGAIALDEGRIPSASSNEPRRVETKPIASDATESSKVAQTPPSSTGASATDLSTLEGRSEAHSFSSGEYRILKVEFLNGRGEPTRQFRFGDSFRLRVHYECLLDRIPEVSCGVAAALTSAHELQHVMYFNTNYPHSDSELATYYEAPFRQYRGRTGVIEAEIPYLQVKAGEYLVTVGLVPNHIDLHQFYELQYLAYKVAVMPNGYPEPSVFYPLVTWNHGPIDEAEAGLGLDRKRLS